MARNKQKKNLWNGLLNNAAELFVAAGSQKGRSWVAHHGVGCFFYCPMGIFVRGSVHPVFPSALPEVGAASSESGGILRTSLVHPLGGHPECHKMNAGLQGLLAKQCELG